MKLYYRLVGLLVLLVASFGLVLPFLISAPSDFAVAGGLFYLLVVLPFVTVKLVAPIIKTMKDKGIL